METIPSLEETRVLLEIMSLPSLCHIPFYISWSCRDDSHICNGQSFDECVRTVIKSQSSNCLAIGINCTNPSVITSLLNIARPILLHHNTPPTTINDGSDSKSTSNVVEIKQSLWSPVLLCYPNSGEIWQASDNTWLPPPSLPSPLVVSTAVSTSLASTISTNGGATKGSSSSTTTTTTTVQRRWGEMANEWRRLGGARIIGGCCRTYTEHIALLRSMVCRPMVLPRDDDSEDKDTPSTIANPTPPSSIVAT
jgi:S-methylmethionine-dependent homocysteine/selenocysteine methylase